VTTPYRNGHRPFPTAVSAYLTTPKTEVTADEPDDAPAPPVDPKDDYAQWCAMVVGREDETYGKRRPTPRSDKAEGPQSRSRFAIWPAHLSLG
jgi:hypothetical protein